VYADRQKKPLPAYMRTSCEAEFEQRYSYLLHQKGVIYPPVLDVQRLNFFEEYQVGDIKFSGFPMAHGEIESCGFRIGNTAYALDMRYLTDPKSFEALQGIETLIIDAAGYHYPSNPVHATLEDVYAYQAKIGAKRVILSVLSVAMDYKTVQNEIPEGYEVAYDGLSFKGVC
ncbi:MAG: MBL fold metallo-hydrolase, partial [Pseudobdellovibrionaceae bacterium]